MLHPIYRVNFELITKFWSDQKEYLRRLHVRPVLTYAGIFLAGQPYVIMIIVPIADRRLMHTIFLVELVA